MVVDAGVGATLVGTLLTVAILGLKAGQWKREMEQAHKRQENAHQMVHEDVAELIEALGYTTSGIDDCPTCADDD